MTSDRESLIVTGGSGFIGRQVIRQAVEQGWRVLCVDRIPPGRSIPVEYVNVDEKDADFWKRCLDRFSPKCIIHLAGVTRTRDLDALIKGNVVLTHLLFDAIRDADPTIKVVLPDSAASIGSPVALPVTEDHQYFPVNAYGVSKVCQMLLGQSYYLRHAMPIVIGRIFNITGPGEPPGLVCRDMATKILQAEKQVHLCSPKISRDFLDVRDVASALLLLLTRGTPGQIYNICSGTEVTLETIGDILSKLITSESKIIWSDEGSDNSVRNIYGTNEKIRQLGWNPKYNLEQSLRSMVDLLKQPKVASDGH